MKPLQVLDCYLLVTMKRTGRISTRQFREIASDLGTSIARVEKSLDFLVAIKLVRVLAGSGCKEGQRA